MDQELDRLAGKLLQGVLAPDKLPDAVASLAAWLQPQPGAELTALGNVSPYCPMLHNGSTTGCRRTCPNDETQAADECAVCSLLDGGQPNWQRIIDLLIHCRTLRGFADHAANSANTSHVAAIVLDHGGHVLDCDQRGESFLKAGNVLHIQDGELHCCDPALHGQFAAALRETAAVGRIANLLLYMPEHPDKRYSLTLSRLQSRSKGDVADHVLRVPNILCLIAPLDGRRIATARQLMDIFGLSAAEARLARAVCHGDSVEAYARDQGLRLPTVRSQLSSIFNKTGTDRQASLVRLIADIPVVRDGT